MAGRPPRFNGSMIADFVSQLRYELGLRSWQLASPADADEDLLRDLRLGSKQCQRWNAVLLAEQRVEQGDMPADRYRTVVAAAEKQEREDVSLQLQALRLLQPALEAAIENIGRQPDDAVIQIRTIPSTAVEENLRAVGKLRDTQ